MLCITEIMYIVCGSTVQGPVSTLHTLNLSTDTHVASPPLCIPPFCKPHTNVYAHKCLRMCLYLSPSISLSLPLSLSHSNGKVSDENRQLEGALDTTRSDLERAKTALAKRTAEWRELARDSDERIREMNDNLGDVLALEEADGGATLDHKLSMINFYRTRRQGDIYDDLDDMDVTQLGSGDDLSDLSSSVEATKEGGASDGDSSTVKGGARNKRLSRSRFASVAGRPEGLTLSRYSSVANMANMRLSDASVPDMSSDADGEPNSGGSSVGGGDAGNGKGGKGVHTGAGRSRGASTLELAHTYLEDALPHRPTKETLLRFVHALLINRLNGFIWRSTRPHCSPS